MPASRTKLALLSGELEGRVPPCTLCLSACVALQLPPDKAQEQQELRASLRWRRLQDEVRDCSEELQVLR